MDFVITLIAAANERLDTFADSMAAAFEAQGARVAWLKPAMACDIFLQGDDADALTQKFRAIIGGKPIDAIVQPVEGRRKKLLISDMDSTMITIECLDELSDFVGKKAEVSAITDRAMNGEIDFPEALALRVAMLAGLSESALKECYDQRVKMMPGGKELVSVMKQNGAKTLLVSGGFTYFTSRVAKELGFDEDLGNVLEVKDGKLTGKIIPPILGKEAKLAALQAECKKMNIMPADVLAVGDGANDLPMLLAAGLGIAYHAKPNVRAQARAQVNHTDLTALLYAQGYTF